jgi:transposase
MSRVNPIDVGMPAGCRVDKAGSAVGFEDLRVRLPRTEHECPKCGRPMTGHGSFPKTMAHAVGHAPCRLTVTVPRSGCRKCGVTVSEEVTFASAVSTNATEALEVRVVGLLGQRSTVKEAAALCGVPYDTVRLVIDGVHVNKPKLPRALLMDEVHAYSYREHDTGKLVAVYWTCAYDGEDGKVIDVIEGHDAEALDKWYSQFSAEERNHVKSFCSDMYDTFLNAAKKWLPLAVRAVDRFHVAKDGVAHMDEARRRIQKGAGNGASIKRRARKLAVNRGKRSREHAGEAWVEREKRVTYDILCVCDEKHSQLRQAFLVLQLYYEWQDAPWDDREACDKALCDWIMKASGIPVPEMAAFASTVNDYRQQLVTGTVEHINSARAESANDKIKELKKRGRGFGGFAETRKRLLIAFGKPGAVELPTARKRRLEQIAARKAEAKAKAAAKAKRAKRKRR